MDRHDIAHYVIAAAIAIGGGSALYREAASPKLVNALHVTRARAELWSPLSDSETETLSGALGKLRIPRLHVFCVGINCQDIAADVSAAARRAGIESSVDLAFSADPGLSVGSPDADQAAAIASAIGPVLGKQSKPKATQDKRMRDAYITFGTLAP